MTFLSLHLTRSATVKLAFHITSGLAIALFAGCTTSAVDIRAKAPSLQLQSDKSAKVIASCIAEKWESLYPMGSLNVRPTATGYSVVQQDQVLGGKDIPFFADIDERGTGSTTKYYNNAISARKIDQSVMDCQK